MDKDIYAKPFARVGERVTLEDGTYVCRVAKDLYISRRTSVDHFDDWQIEKPQPHTEVKPNSGFRTGTKGGMQVHINGKWLPEGPPLK